MAIAIANRYARALADVIGSAGNYRTVLQELSDFTAAYRQSADLREVLQTPVLPVGEKIKVLDALLARLGASRVTSNFLRVLMAHYRMGLLEQVEEAFRRISNDRLGIARVKIFAASDLTDAERGNLSTRFERLTQKRAELEFRLDPTLIGGIVAQIGSTVYDGSVRGHLERLRQQLVADVR